MEAFQYITVNQTKILQQQKMYVFTVVLMRHIFENNKWLNGSKFFFLFDYNIPMLFVLIPKFFKGISEVFDHQYIYKYIF